MATPLSRAGRAWPLRALLGLFVLLAGGYSALIPLGEAADEVSHYSYVRYVATHRALPPVIPGTTVYGETFQPPLYYVLAAPLTAWLPATGEENLGLDLPVENNPAGGLPDAPTGRLLLQPAAARWPWQGEALAWHLARGLSVLLGVVTIAATAALGRRLFPGEPWTGWLAALLVALLPTFTGLSAAVTNDSLATMLAALLLLQIARLCGEGPERRRDWVVVGLLGGLGVWTKSSGWIFVATVVVAALVAAPHRAPRRLAAAGLSWLVVVLPLAALNLARSGDLLGRGIQQQVTEARPGLDLATLGALLEGLNRTWWAGFGGAVHLSFSRPLSLLLTAGLGVALSVGLARRHLQRGSAPAITRRLVPLLLLHILFVGAAWLLWSRLVLGTGQGRLLFPALPAIAVLAAGGLAALAPSRHRHGPLAVLPWAILMTGVALAALLTVLLPAYRAAPPTAAAPAGVVTSPRWQVGTLPLYLSGHFFPLTIDDRPRPADRSRLYTRWESTGALPDLRLRLRWLDGEGTLWQTSAGTPLAGHPLTDEWRPGRYAAWHKVQIPTDAPPGYYRLMLSLFDPATGETLPISAPGIPPGDEIMVGQTTVVVP